jgi:uncharacterized membrane protein
MRERHIRRLTWALVAFGAAFVVLGVALVVAYPVASAGASPFPGGRAWRDGAQEGGADPWLSGRGHGFARMAGGRACGGGALIGLAAVGGVAVLGYAALARKKGPEADAVEALRRAFAEGRVTEEEYKSRLKVLREGGAV